MKIISSITEMQSYIRGIERGSTIGFVPTMGYLHQGHLSLVQNSIKECDQTVVSIFVNPTQFGPNEDFDSYPRDLDKDLDMLLSMGVDIVFTPTKVDMYPLGYKTYTEVEDLSNVLCGASRPGHFRGVATIVQKLVNIVQPTHMFMGIKDYQQVVVLETMLRDLNLTCRIVRCPIMRENDGLAMSSRNSYLNQDERQRALCLRKAILRVQEAYQKGVIDSGILVSLAEACIEESAGKIDYIQIVSPSDLMPVDTVKDDSRIVLAVYIGKTRLIDNDCLCG